jgi:hypothetical protein
VFEELSDLHMIVQTLSHRITREIADITRRLDALDAQRSGDRPLTRPQTHTQNEETDE